MDVCLVRSRARADGDGQGKRIDGTTTEDDDGQKENARARAMGERGERVVESAKKMTSAGAAEEEDARRSRARTSAETMRDLFSKKRASEANARRVAFGDASNARVTSSSIERGEFKKTRAVEAGTQTDFEPRGAIANGGGESKDDAGGEDVEVDVDKAFEDIEGGKPSRIAFDLRVMSGNHTECGICLTAFDDDAGVVRHMFYPCQHVRQCGDCAQRVWQVPKARRRCPWCKSKIEIRPRAFKPFV